MKRRWKQQFRLSGSYPSVYEQLKQIEARNSASARTRTLIHKDVCRTYKEISNYETWKSKTENILAVLATVYTDMGYCQGMSFIAGAILNVIQDEELCFWIFVGLIEKYRLELLFMNVLSASHHRACQQCTCTCTYLRGYWRRGCRSWTATCGN